jgi:hypothetical protein
MRLNDEILNEEINIFKNQNYKFIKIYQPIFNFFMSLKFF